MQQKQNTKAAEVESKILGFTYLDTKTALSPKVIEINN